MLRSNLVCVLALLLSGALWMLSCGSSTPPDRLTIHLTAHHSAPLVHVDACVSGAPAPEVYIDEHGLGKTSVCPAANHNVEVDIVDGDRRYRLTAEKVQVRRTGDGLATSVEAQLAD
jgi:hypothetical protein